MKRVYCIVLAVIMALIAFPVYTAAASTDFLIGDWSTSDGVYLSFYDDGFFEMEWGYFPAEEGEWYASSLTDDTFYIEMDGSLILSLMSMVYGSADSDYHFEVLKCNEDNFYLVQVYGDYTAKTSKCKLGFTRDGAKSNFAYTEDDVDDVDDETDDNKPFEFTIISNKDDNHNFVFNNENVEDLILSQESVDYNPRICHFLACMARSAYSKDLVIENYEKMGFNNHIQRHYDKGSPFAPFTIGDKVLDDGSRLVFITIRGSGNIIDVTDNNTWTQTNFNLGNDTLIFSHGWHSGFLASEEEVFKYLKSFLGGSIKTNNITYIITGHSLGAAVGNLLSIQLFNEGVSTEDLYDYNFACPNVAMGSDDISEWNYRGCHNNIINVANWCDYVSHAPGVLFESIDKDFNWSKWNKYGKSYWFDNGFQFMPTAHDMGVYLDYIEKEKNESEFRETEYVVRTVSAWCPVDVEIYDKQGNLIVGTINNEPQYYGHEEGEIAVAYIDGDRKTFHILNEEEYDVRLNATATGDMKFGIGTLNMSDNEVLSEKWFNSVSLTDDKKMICSFGMSMDINSVKLYVVDDNDSIIAEIMEDGSERVITEANVTEINKSFDKALVKTWWIYLLIGGIIISIGILIVFVVIRIKKKKAAERRRRAENDPDDFPLVY